jgi:hexosaminidase
MTDSQSWPLDIPSMPELSQEGAYLRGLSYSPADFKYIQMYAVERGIEVITEFDMPGHTSALGLSHPELLTAYQAHPWSRYCAEPPCGSLKLNSPVVDAFLEKLFDDVLPRVAPYSSYFHTGMYGFLFMTYLVFYPTKSAACTHRARSVLQTHNSHRMLTDIGFIILGGDEVKLAAYSLDETILSDKFTVIQPFLQKFVNRNHDQVRKAGLTPIVWEEMALDWNLTLGSDVVVQSWMSDEAVVSITAKGHKVSYLSADLP